MHSNSIVISDPRPGTCGYVVEQGSTKGYLNVVQINHAGQRGEVVAVVQRSSWDVLSASVKRAETLQLIVNQNIDKIKEL